MWSNPTALYRLIGIRQDVLGWKLVWGHSPNRRGIHSARGVSPYLRTSITRRRTSVEVQDIVSTIGDNGYMFLASKNPSSAELNFPSTPIPLLGFHG